MAEGRAPIAPRRDIPGGARRVTPGSLQIVDYLKVSTL